ncbi:cell division transport system ATP-binding protein [Draconibacterium orientale]|uniref:Cell division transport system ATP-binding protein n=1 Tax=Draconibacterium orientale TaxID=1168034 RepID=X5DJ93_9BACT|nr:ATP-binding cassette domain-containing protein [Draconibacterium orientale]AHW61189.1 phosphonate ABC transporter ATP-binding protein [Draconibacterium orientale]SET36477.1 cell division transport system ATP-binding protein [Draconibacterium orientale]
MDKKTVIKLLDASIYQYDNLVLSGVDVEVKEGEFIYVVGKVGTGKTSLIKMLNAELPLEFGFGSVLDFDLVGLKKRNIPYLRRRLGVVFQDFRLLTDRNVYANLAFVLKATGWKNKLEIENRVDEVLERVGMLHKKEKMPHQLSGGEQQRVVIARAILNYADIILADEPTGNLDPETSEDILDLFIQLNNDGKTILMATHDYAAIAKKPARTWVCVNGKLNDSAKNTEEIEFENLLEKNV